MLNQFYKDEALKLHILLVEDDDIMRKVIKSQLELMFGRVLIATNGFEAINIYKEEIPYLVVTDLHMPKMGGIDFIKHVRRDNIDTPIVVLSSTDDINELKECINYGVDGFISKPINGEQLIITLSKVVKNIVDKKYNEIYKDKIKNYNGELLKKNRELEKLVKLYDVRVKQEHKKVEVEKLAKPKKQKVLKEKLPELNIEKEHLDDILEIEEELDSFISIVVLSQKLENKWMIKISNTLNKYREYINLYGFTNVAESMFDLAQNLKNTKDIDRVNEKNAIDYLDSFLYILKRFREDILQRLDTKKDIHFFDDSIIADIKQIILILKNENVDGDIEFF